MTNSTVSDSPRVRSADATSDGGHASVSSADAVEPQRADAELVDAQSGEPGESATSAPVAASSAVGGLPASAPRTPRTMSVLALSLGIASFFFAQSVVVPLAAIVFGVFGLRDEPTGRTFSTWGIVLACVATFGWVFVVAAGALLFLPFAFLGAL